MAHNSWIQTYTGIPFDIINPDPDHINITDIAHALSMLCRYGGHTSRFYSVAEHSVLVSQLCVQYPREGLMHDAQEAYLQDICRPIKPHLVGYAELESKLYSVIASVFGLLDPIPDEVVQADFNVLGSEKAELMADGPVWHYISDPLPEVCVVGLCPAEAEALFLRTFHNLGWIGGAST